MLCGESTNTNVISLWFDPTWLKPTIYRTGGEHVKHYTTDAVDVWKKKMLPTYFRNIKLQEISLRMAYWLQWYTLKNMNFALYIYYFIIYICIADEDPLSRGGGFDPINRFNPFLCLSQSRTLISICKYWDIFCV